MKRPTTPGLFDADLMPKVIGGHSHRADPDTSREAGRKARDSGAIALQAEIVLDAVRQWPNKTACELASLAGMDRHAVSRRLPELREAGLVVSGQPRQCTVAGSTQLTWRATGCG